MKTSPTKLITRVTVDSCISSRKNVSLYDIRMLIFVRHYSIYSCGRKGETFESINLLDGLISGLTVLCALLTVIVLVGS